MPSSTATWYIFNMHDRLNRIQWKCAHNTQSGAGAERHSKEELMSKIWKPWIWLSIFQHQKRGWKDIDPDTDFLIVAGGDGTVRKVTKRLLNRKILRKRFPMHCYHWGLQIISQKHKYWRRTWIIGRTWTEENLKKIDIGFIQGLSQPNFSWRIRTGNISDTDSKMKESDEKSFSNLPEEINIHLKYYRRPSVLINRKICNCKLMVKIIPAGTCWQRSWISVQSVRI